MILQDNLIIDITGDSKTLVSEKIDNFITCSNDLFNKDEFISKSKYKDIYNDFSEIYSKIQTAVELNAVNNFCNLYKINRSKVLTSYHLYNNYTNLVDRHNKAYIKKHLKEEEAYFNNILKEIDKNITLDEDQREIILNDEDYCLVIAGAGAGKTTTIAAKVRYLVERKGISPEDILIISFTNKAIDELKERINKQLGIDCIISTFHSTGHRIIRNYKEFDKLNVVNEGYLYNITKKYLLDTVKSDESMLKKIIMFFGYYISTPFDDSNLERFFMQNRRNDFTTLKSNLKEINKIIVDNRTKKKITINNEVLRSVEEVKIANFLYLNGIDYEYESPYQYQFENATKLYTPDFYISQDNKNAYIEHFGISESGKNHRYSKEELEKYLSIIDDKRRLHSKHGTTLIESYSSYNDGRNLLDHLEEKLMDLGFKFVKRNDKEIYDKLALDEESKYFHKLIELVCRFIHNFKTYGFTEQEFKRMINLSNSVRTKLFVEICQRIYLNYQNMLKENNLVDFEDMINESEYLLSNSDKKDIINYKYIIVDEYQDISRQRFNLTNALSKVTNAKIVAVGDDWQSIFAFAGSDISLFTEFKKSVGYADVLFIKRTYRNAQELIDIAGDFIQQNDKQIKKQLISNKSIKKPVVLFTYDDDYRQYNKGKKGVLYEKAKLIEKIIGKILSVSGLNSSILLIGRYGFEGVQLCNTTFFKQGTENHIISTKYPDVSIDYLTAHSSKGLTYDNVIIINAIDDVYGFPSQIEIDPVLKLVINEDLAIKDAEERRLFYVALTRTKNRVFIIVPENKPSSFILELLQNYTNITLHGNLNCSSTKPSKMSLSCPNCGYPIQLRYSTAYGLKLYMCTNEDELCGFITNDMNGGNNPIRKCPTCTDGYLIIKKRRDSNSYFLGCTNYKDNKEGCNEVVSIN